MLTDSEKAYCQALLALKKKDYSTAAESFQKAACDFGTNDDFNLLYDTTQLLLAVKQELAEFDEYALAEDKELTTDG